MPPPKGTLHPEQKETSDEERAKRKGNELTLPAFELHRPRSLDDALQILAETPGATPLGGGTCLLVDLRQRKRSADALIDLSRIETMRGIRTEDGALVLGAMTTIAELLTSELVREYAPVLRAACNVFAAPLVRNRATLGGNLAHGSPAADAAPPLLALDANVELQSRNGSRVVPLREFFVSPCQTVRTDAELVTALRVPLCDQGPAWAYEKLGLRKADAISVVSAAAVRMPDDGTVRIALGAVAPVPIRARAAEEKLGSEAWSTVEIAEAARLAADEARPIDDVRGSAAYRKRQAEILVRRCLERVGEGGEARGA